MIAKSVLGVKLDSNSNSRREVGVVGGIKGSPVLQQMVFICCRVNSKTSFPVETLKESTSNIHGLGLNREA